MFGSFTYDVAISHVSEDALTARYLIERLRPRLRAPIFSPAMGRGGAGVHLMSAAPCADARIVVVLHQRSWGETATTRTDREAIERRVAQQGTGFLVVVALDPSAEPPAWMDGMDAPLPLSWNGLDEIEAIAAAVRQAGGLTHPPGTDVPADGDGGTTGAWGEGGAEALRTTGAAKLASAAQREAGAVMTELEERAEDLRASFPDVQVDVRRGPERCVVQAGNVAVSVSWLRSAAADNGEGSLLVIEWRGTVTFPGEAAMRTRRATAVREHVLHLEAVAWPDWNWSADDAPMRKYTSPDLASLCLRLVRQRLEEEGEAVALLARDGAADGA